jgi:hypothetical protein
MRLLAMQRQQVLMILKQMMTRVAIMERRIVTRAARVKVEK